MMSSDVEKLGVIRQNVIDKLNLSISPDTPIYIGLGNRIHMENSHADDYNKYADCLCDIIEFPDYIGQNPHDDSLEYYKNFGEVIVRVKLAVRPTKSGVYFARTVYEVNENKFNNYLKKGRIKAV